MKAEIFWMVLAAGLAVAAFVLGQRSQKPAPAKAPGGLRETAPLSAWPDPRP